MPDVYNDAPEMAEEVASGAGNDDAAAKAAAEDLAAAAKAEEEAKWAAEAKARAEAKVQAAAAAEAAAKAEAKAAADAAKVALAKAEAEAAAAAQLASEQAAVKAKEAAGAKAPAILAPAAVAEVPLAMAVTDLEAGGDGEKFVTVVTETATDATGRLSQLSLDDARAGLWLLSQRHVDTSKTKLTSFKNHAVELAHTACAPAPEGGTVRGALWKDVKGRQMAELPLGAVYGLMALLFVALFAVVHFPAKYLPIGVAYTKRKLDEHGVIEKAGSAVLAMRTHAKTALQKGLETDMGKKGLELKLKMGGMASQLATSGAVGG